jgi:hypothetical protein
MPTGRRLSTLLLVLALVGAPALVLRLFCVGNSCDAGGTETRASVPFCSLPRELRHAIASGFREGRSPDVMAATSGLGKVSTEVQDGERVDWPGSGTSGTTLGTLPDTSVPIVFLGGGVNPGTVPDGLRLDAIAPTLETITGYTRDHPEVRTGEAIDGVANDRAGPTPLVVVIAWKGLGSPDLEAEPDAWPYLRRALREGSGTLEGETGSLPMDPAATLTTIGTGGLPSAHGITGTTVREDDGDLSEAWSAPEAGSVIATFADDLDHDTDQRARVGAIITDPADRGIIGNGWYVDAADRDRVVGAAGNDPRHAAAAARTIVTSEDLGSDRITDVLGVVLDGRVSGVDAATAGIVATIRDLVPDATFAVAGTGSLRSEAPDDAAELAADVETALGTPVVQGVAADGLFLDRDVLVDSSVTAERVADAMRRERGPDGEALFDDVYPSFAVAFSRYC